MNIIEMALNKLISTVFAVIPRPRPTETALKSVRLVAHRGVHEDNIALENSQKAFDLCLENHIWATELDVRFTADQVPMIVHDENGLRNWGIDLFIAKSTFKEIRAQIPEILSLQEVVARYGKKLHLMIEIKENLGSRPAEVAVLKELLAQLDATTDYHLLALDPLILEPLTFAPKCCYLDVIWLDAKTVTQQNRELKHGAIAGHFLFFSDQKMRELKADGVQVGVGFLDSQNSLYREIARGADFIFTDHALRLVKILHK